MVQIHILINLEWLLIRDRFNFSTDLEESHMKIKNGYDPTCQQVLKYLHENYYLAILWKRYTKLA